MDREEAQLRGVAFMAHCILVGSSLIHTHPNQEEAHHERRMPEVRKRGLEV